MNEDRNKKRREIMQNLVLFTQLGLSLIMPLLMCAGGCYLLCSRLGAPEWIYIPGFILGLGGSFSTTYGVYRSVMKKQKRQKKYTGFNDHS